LQGSSEALVPNSLPQPLLDIARHCLVRDPHRRWTSGAIAAWLRPDASRPERKETASVNQHRQLGEWRFRILMIAIGFVVVLFVGSRIFRHPAETPTVPVVAPATQAQPAPEAAPPKARPAVEKPSPSSASAVGKPKAPMSTAGEHTPGTVIEQVMPAVSKSARDTIQGHFKVDVRVAVDSSGKVTGTKLTSPGPSKYFASKAVEAARGWKFKAAEENGQGVASVWMLRFEFSRKGTTVHPTPTTH
jgi:TonB family protein